MENDCPMASKNIVQRISLVYELIADSRSASANDFFKLPTFDCRIALVFVKESWSKRSSLNRSFADTEGESAIKVWPSKKKKKKKKKN